MSEDNRAEQQAKAQYESICAMVAALDVDYDELALLRDADNLDDDDKVYRDEMLEAAGDCESQDDALERIQEDPLSVEVRGGWVSPGQPMEAEEFNILLCTGGPAVRIIGELSEHGEPDRAWLEYQDWGTPWTQYFDAEQEVLLCYCHQFYFGE